MNTESRRVYEAQALTLVFVTLMHSHRLSSALIKALNMLRMSMKVDSWEFRMFVERLLSTVTNIHRLSSALINFGHVQNFDASWWEIYKFVERLSSTLMHSYPRLTACMRVEQDFHQYVTNCHTTLDSSSSSTRALKQSFLEASKSLKTT